MKLTTGSNSKVLKSLMILAIMSLFASSAIAAPSDSFYHKFYDGYLDGYASDYPIRRVELLRKIPTLRFQDQQIVKSLLVEKDRDYLSRVTSILDLWNLRYRGAWWEVTLVDVADTAIYCLKNFDSKIDVGTSREVGVLAYLQKQLFESGGAQERTVLVKLLIELRSIQARNGFYEAQSDDYLSELMDVAEADMEVLSKQLMTELFEKLKPILYDGSYN